MIHITRIAWGAHKEECFNGILLLNSLLGRCLERLAFYVEVAIRRARHGCV